MAFSWLIATVLIVALIGAVVWLAYRNGKQSVQAKANAATIARLKQNEVVMSRPPGTHADIAARMREINKRMP